GVTLALESDDLARLGPRRNGHLDRVPCRQVDARFVAVDELLQGDRRIGDHVFAAGWPLRAAPRAAAPAPTQVRKNIAEDVVGGKCVAATPAARRPAERATDSDRLAAAAETFESLESLEPRLAVRADLAAVELGALGFV